VYRWLDGQLVPADLGLLVEVALWARAKARPFVILNPARQVQNIMRRTALDKVLPVWQTRLRLDPREKIAPQVALPSTGEPAAESLLHSGRSRNEVISA
jgi:hypothetical protein